MDIPAVQLLCLEQQDRSLEDHTRDFLDLACLKHFPDRSLGIFYITSLSERCKARLPANGPERRISWSGCWREMDFISPSAPPRKLSPAPLTNQRPVSRHPAARSYCLSPPQTESLSPPRLSQSSPQSLSLKHHLTKCVSRQHRPFPREFWWWSRAWREAPPTLPRLRVSCNWFLGTILRN